MALLLAGSLAGWDCWLNGLVVSFFKLLLFMRFAFTLNLWQNVFLFLRPCVWDGVWKTKRKKCNNHENTEKKKRKKNGFSLLRRCDTYMQTLPAQKLMLGALNLANTCRLHFMDISSHSAFNSVECTLFCIQKYKKNTNTHKNEKKKIKTSTTQTNSAHFQCPEILFVISL